MQTKRAILVILVLTSASGCAALGPLLNTALKCLPAFVDIGKGIAKTVENTGNYDSILTSSGDSLGCIGEALHERRASYTAVVTPLEVKATVNLETGMKAVAVRQVMLQTGR
jgi:hypothetical protein